MSKAVVRKDKKNHNSFAVTFENLTQSELLVLKDALSQKAQRHIVPELRRHTDELVYASKMCDVLGSAIEAVGIKT
jgi:hypothetical protein